MPETPTFEDRRAVYDFAESILTKRYELDKWLDNRTGFLLTVNAIFVGVYQLAGPKPSELLQHEKIVLPLMISLQLASTFILLYLISPKFMSRSLPFRGQGFGHVPTPDSDSTDELSLRSTKGIEAHSLDGYIDRFSSINIEVAIRMTADQIKHVNAIIVQETRWLNRAVGLTVASLGILAASIIARLVLSL